MPAWMHDRADHIREKNPDMPKSEAFAIATQQMHALGKSPKGYGTRKGRLVAKKKFKTPEDDVKAAKGTPQQKTAGFMVHYNLEGKAQRSETQNEWLANLLQREGSFMLPAAFHKQAFAAFADELEKMASEEKDSGFMDVLKKPIPHTPPMPGSGFFRAAERVGEHAAAKGGPSKDFLAYQAREAAKRAAGTK